MNLKRLRGIAAVALATIAAALIAGCSNSLAGSIDEGAAGNSNARMATLSLSATGIPNDYAEQFAKSYPEAAARAAARSITPDNPYTPSSTGLAFYLSGTSETGKKLDDMEVTLALKAGSTDEYEFVGNVVLDSMSWNLILTAYIDSPTNTKSVLQGFCSVDLCNGSGTASFKLSPEKLTTPGSVHIEGQFIPNSNVASWTMGIYRKDSPSDKIDEASATLAGDGVANEPFEYDCSSVAPGSYLYKMVFKNAAGTITGSFVDTLIVDAGNPLNRNIGTLDVINRKPGDPTDFTASLEDNSENSDGTYRVKLSWKSGKGETNFEVELTEFTDGGTTESTDSPKIYGMSSMDTGTPKTVENFQGSDVWAGKGGAMTYGDEEAYFNLKLGVVYEVRIRARNYVGVSDWVDRIALATADTGFTPYGAEKINRMKIEYNLDGGTLILYDSNGNKTKTVKYTEYQSWKGTDLDLLEIDNTSDLKNQLKKGDSLFQAWRDAAKTVVTTADYKNLSVTAFYGSSVEGSITMADKKSDVELGDITVTYGTSTSPAANAVTLTDSNATYAIPKKIGTPKEETNLRIVLDTTPGYKNISFELTYKGVETLIPLDDGLDNTCTLKLDNYVAGKINVRVIADTKNATGMSQTLIFDLE